MAALSHRIGVTTTTRMTSTGAASENKAAIAPIDESSGSSWSGSPPAPCAFTATAPAPPPAVEAEWAGGGAVDTESVVKSTPKAKIVLWRAAGARSAGTARGRARNGREMRWLSGRRVLVGVQRKGSVRGVRRTTLMAAMQKE